ncbi:OmpH family outer membrane protein [uncultured Pseudodesulfovibrio sp.]|jgi:outer membrane protein|uniref:OmpH family outer membrane protein n=1 Tax=uncultured Pseudodesulfovibrio sp. TaxID=2035858 RepID=UPI0029C8D88A|nr:OmpH family outer membrane protein [uncultured Pseudodesulfovibrio sp.]
MKKVMFLAIAFVLVFQVSAFAESKIGVFNMQAVMLQCDYGKAVAAKLKAKFTPMEKDLKKDGEAIKKLEAELKNQDLALKLEAKQDKQREFRRLARDYQDSVAAYRQKRQMEQQKLGQPIVEKIVKVMSEYGKANGYTVIFEMAASGVSYVGDGIDITKPLIAELNKLKKAGK